MTNLKFTNATADFIKKHSPKAKIKTEPHVFFKYVDVIQIVALIGCALLAYFTGYGPATVVVYALTALYVLALLVMGFIYFVYSQVDIVTNRSKKKLVIANAAATYWNNYFIKKQAIKFSKYDDYVVIATLLLCGFIIPAMVYGGSIYMQYRLNKMLGIHAATIQREVDALYQAENDRFHNAKDITSENN